MESKNGAEVGAKVNAEKAGEGQGGGAGRSLTKKEKNPVPIHLKIF